MKSTKSRSDAGAREGGGGAIPSRWNESRRRVVSSTWATTSRTTHAPATVGCSHCSIGKPRRRVIRLMDTGRNHGRVSIGTGNSSGISLPLVLRSTAKTRWSCVCDATRHTYCSRKPSSGGTTRFSERPRRRFSMGRDIPWPHVLRWRSASHQQGRWHVTRVITAAVMMTWMAAAGERLTSQDLGIERSDVAAIRVSVETLAQHVGQFAGLRVRVSDAIVDHVVSPRAFVLTGQRTVVGLNGPDYVGVILPESLTANVVKAMPIVVTGAAE